VARVQALKIAAGFPNVSPRLVFSGFREHMWSVKFDFRHKGLDAVYFEIWKRVAKQKMDFREALLEVYHGKMFPSWILDIDLELENTTRARFSMKDKVWLSLSVLFVHIPTLMVDVFPLIKSYRNLILFLFFSIMLTWPALMIW